MFSIILSKLGQADKIMIKDSDGIIISCIYIMPDGTINERSWMNKSDGTIEELIEAPIEDEEW